MINQTKKAWSYVSKGVLFLLSVAAFFLNALITHYIMETICRDSSGIMDWMIAYPRNYWAGVFNIFFVSVALLGLTGKGNRAVRWTNAFFIVLADINYFKIDYRGEPLMFSDLWQMKEGVSVLSHYHLRIPPLLIIFTVLTIVIIPMLFKPVHFQLSVRKKTGLVVATVFLFAGWLHFYFTLPYRDDYRTDSIYNYAGFLRGIWATRPHGMEMPEEYSKEKTERLLTEYCEGAVDNNLVKPDIFFVMCESLYDIAGSGTQVLTRDPLGPFKEKVEAYTGGKLLSSSYGGGTFNVEYEVLTGYRCQDISGALFNNRAAIYRGMDTVPSMLKECGYETAAFHSNTGRFYSRNIDYPLMGFDAAYFPYDGLDKEREEIRDWLTNRWLLTQVLEKYDEHDSGTPYFAHIVTTQGHGGFAFDWDIAGIDVISPSEMPYYQSAKTFANITGDAVDALIEFLDALQARKRPCVVVIWGDHSPALNEFGTQIPEDTFSQAFFYETPLLVWNNYGADFSLDEEMIPAYRLGAWITHSLGLNKDPYYEYLAVSGNPDMLVHLRLLEKDGKFYEDDVQFGIQDREMRALHYYRLQKGKD